MSFYLTNPYKRGTPQKYHRVSFDVSEADWKWLRQLVPESGVGDVYFSNLFYGFIQEARKQNLTIPTNEDEFTAIKKQLSRIVRRRSDPPAT